MAWTIGRWSTFHNWAENTFRGFNITVGVDITFYDSYTHFRRGKGCQCLIQSLLRSSQYCLVAGIVGCGDSMGRMNPNILSRHTSLFSDHFLNPGDNFVRCIYKLAGDDCSPLTGFQKENADVRVVVDLSAETLRGENGRIKMDLGCASTYFQLIQFLRDRLLRNFCAYLFFLCR